MTGGRKTSARLLAAALFVLALSRTIYVSAAEPSVWFRADQPVPQLQEVLRLLEGADTFGLDPSDYTTGLSESDLSTIASARTDAATRTRIETAVTGSLSRFISHLHYGRVSAANAGFHLPPASRDLDPLAAVQTIASAVNVTDAINAFEPRPLPYRMLKAALHKYRDLAKQAQLTQLPALPSSALRLGGEYRGIEQLRSLLIALGDMPAMSGKHDASLFDGEFTTAIQHFQLRHGLDPDGVIGSRTFAALTTPFDRRVRQIELTMERWRWLHSSQRPDIVVNIPQFMLYALPRKEDGSSPLEMSVIVGQSTRRTPIFTATIKRIIFQPYWDVPRSILVRELLPLIRADGAYLARHHMEIVRGQGDDATVLEPGERAIEALAGGQARLRQRPGPDNALGPVKFVLPNPYNIYLHGTPQQYLFERSRRALSHGCIRVSEPAQLAAYVLKNAATTWDEETIEQAMCGTKTLRIELKTPVPVLIFYGTAAATTSRGVLFSADVYGYDDELETLLAQAAHPVRTAISP